MLVTIFRDDKFLADVQVDSYAGYRTYQNEDQPDLTEFVSLLKSNKGTGETTRAALIRLDHPAKNVRVLALRGEKES